MEKNIASVQERIKIEAEMDDTWADDDNDDRNVRILAVICTIKTDCFISTKIEFISTLFVHR